MNKSGEHVIFIDPGHGGRDSGAIGPGGLMEKRVALRISQYVWLELDQWKANTFASRQSDVFVSLDDRAAKAESVSADLFVSIHANASPSHEGHGYEVWTSPGETDADVLATLIFDEMAEAFPGRRGRADMSDGDVDKEARFRVLMKTSMPAVLVEVGFIDNIPGESFLSDDASLRKIASAIAAGIIAFLNLGIDEPEEPEDQEEFDIESVARNLVEATLALQLVQRQLKDSILAIQDQISEIQEHVNGRN